MKALSFGEILWDVFETHKCPGGAPLNVAVHLRRLGFDSFILSATGKDARGKEILDIVKAEGVETQFIEQVAGFETGYTKIVLDEGVPDYAFNENCAWDSIVVSQESEKLIVSQDWDVFCFGSLAQRSSVSRKTLERILPHIKARIVFFDVNIRKNFYTPEVLEFSLQAANILKMNGDECPIMANTLFPNEFSHDFFDRDKALDFWSLLCQKIMKRFSIEGILISDGKNGTKAFFGDTSYSVLPGKVAVVDTVGAGDSLSAGFLAAYSSGKSVLEALETGTLLADYVVAHEGAFPPYDKSITEVLQKRLA